MRLNSVLQALMLRRMKADSRGSGPLVQLPPKTVEIAYLDFSPSEAAAYAPSQSSVCVCLASLGLCMTCRSTGRVRYGLCLRLLRARCVQYMLLYAVRAATHRPPRQLQGAVGRVT